MNISKELFEAVMDLELLLFNIDKTYIYARARNKSQYVTTQTGQGRVLTQDFGMSINDFFFKCKEWALKQQICLVTGAEEYMPSYWQYVCYQSNRYRPDHQNRFKNPLVEHKLQTPTMHGNDEKQCLFDACQWILDNKE